MKIGLIYLNKNGAGIPPVGFISIASSLKQKFPRRNVEIIDVNFIDPFQKIFSSGYDLIGISCVTKKTLFVPKTA